MARDSPFRGIPIGYTPLLIWTGYDRSLCLIPSSSISRDHEGLRRFRSDPNQVNALKERKGIIRIRNAFYKTTPSPILILRSYGEIRKTMRLIIQAMHTITAMGRDNNFAPFFGSWGDAPFIIQAACVGNSFTLWGEFSTNQYFGPPIIFRPSTVPLSITQVCSENVPLLHRFRDTVTNTPSEESRSNFNYADYHTRPLSRSQHLRLSHLITSTTLFGINPQETPPQHTFGFVDSGTSHPRRIQMQSTSHPRRMQRLEREFHLRSSDNFHAQFSIGHQVHLVQPRPYSGYELRRNGPYTIVDIYDFCDDAIVTLKTGPSSFQQVRAHRLVPIFESPNPQDPDY